jgi:hypothetical protein
MVCIPFALSLSVKTPQPVEADSFFTFLLTLFYALPPVFDGYVRPVKVRKSRVDSCCHTLEAISFSLYFSAGRRPGACLYAPDHSKIMRIFCKLQYDLALLICCSLPARGFLRWGHRGNDLSV